MTTELLYDRLWSDLNQATLAPPTEQQLSITFSAALHYFNGSTATKVISLRHFSPSDTSYLEAEGISREYLSRNLDRTINGKFRDAREFQLRAIRKQAIRAVCPFSGSLVESNHSLLANINVIFYRFTSSKVFYVITAGIGTGFQKCAVYFPELELAVTAGDEWSFDDADLQELKARVVCNSVLCHQYLCDQGHEKRKTAVCLGFYHFAHHLWNELSGIHRICRAGLLDSVGRFLVTREPLGKLEQLFPEIPASKVVRRANTAELFVEILTNRYFAIKVGDDFITRDLGQRVRVVALSNCRVETHARLAEFKQQHSPVLWIGIRVGNRSWANQVDGLTDLVTALHLQFPKLGIVFDGFSLPADRTMESADRAEFTELLSQENEVVSQVVQRLEQHKGLGIFNIIGGSIFDASVWANQIDVYLSPYGTLQHKVGWLANKVGVIHTNQTLLQNPARYVWSAVEGAYLPLYVSPDSVKDVQDDERGDFAYNGIRDASESGAGIQANNKRVLSASQFNNYEVDWTSLRDDLVRLLQSPAKGRTLRTSILLNASKRKLRTAIQSVTGRLNFSGI